MPSIKAQREFIKYALRKCILTEKQKKDFKRALEKINKEVRNG